NTQRLDDAGKSIRIRRCPPPRVRGAERADALRDLSAARPWPSVEKPTVRTDRASARTPSAIRPWTPRHRDLQRYKVTPAGTEKKRIRSGKSVGHYACES